MRRKLFCLALFVLMAVPVRAAVVPITSVTSTTMDNPGGAPNFWLESITVGNYTVTVNRLVTGKSEGVATAQPAPYNDITAADNLDLNLFAGRADENPPTHTITEFGGKPAWVDTNGDNPDFFVFETGGNQDIGVAAILPGGTVGQTVSVPQATFGDTGLVITTSGPHNGQTIEGIAFAITDFLDQNGNNLTNDSVIEGIQVASLGYDPSCVCAVLAGKILFASNPSPADGALHSDTWVSLSWMPGDSAESHDVYLSESFDDVNAGPESAFRGNQTLTFYIAGFPGNAYPDGLVPGTTYYWRIDEVNDSEPNSPWEGPVWSFSIPPKTAYNPDPIDGTESIDLNVALSWTAGFGTKLHYIFFGEDFDEVSNAVVGVPNGTVNYSPGPLNLAKTYYWRVDEFDGIETHKGDVWSFTTLGAVSGPNPANGAADVSPTQILTWGAGAVAASHEVYFGMDADAVKNATKSSPEYKGPKALGEESYGPGKLTLNTAYYWRIDEVNGINPDSPWAGNGWSFTTGDFFVIDDFELYDANDNQIWYSWHDGLGYGVPGVDPYFAGNGTGGAIGDEATASYTEETIVHGGSQSMPVAYDNNKQGYAYYSEVEHTLTDQRDWTEEGVVELSLWFYGDPNNSDEPLYVAVSNSSGAPAVVIHNNPDASVTDVWTEWVIPLQALADQGIVLTNVDRIAIGLGTQGNMTIPGGSGKMLFDDIRLNQPREIAE